MKIIANRYSVLGLILCIGLLLTGYTQWKPTKAESGYSWNSNLEPAPLAEKRPALIDTKQRGAHVFGRMDTANVQRMQQNNIEWVTLVPWASQKDFDGAEVIHHNGERSHIQYHDSSWVHQIEAARADGFKVFFKPHVWIRSPSAGKWRSDVFPANEKNWTDWRNSYRDFILRYARVAQLAQAEMFCVGTEFSRLSIEKPEFWRELIKEVRCVYSGEITYAANWYREFDLITFWGDVDYIGIQAYFPLVASECPSVQQVSAGWARHLPAIASVHEKYDREVLFTEIGYKSTADSGIAPWEWIDDPSDQSRGLSPETQANCYQAFFDTVWEQEWFAGVHLWQFRGDWAEDSGRANLDFTPQGKMAEKIIATAFERQP